MCRLTGGDSGRHAMALRMRTVVGGEVQTRVEVIGEVEKGGDFCGRLDVHGIYARLYPSGYFWWDLAERRKKRGDVAREKIKNPEEKEELLEIGPITPFCSPFRYQTRQAESRIRQKKESTGPPLVKSRKRE